MEQIKGLMGDLDGDLYSGVFVSDELPKHTRYLIKYLNEDHTHEEKIAQVLKFAEVNKKKVKSLSKRNQKRLLSRLGYYYNENTGQLIDQLKYRRRGKNSPYTTIKIKHQFTEKNGTPLERFFSTWVNSIGHG